jgi:hypothetical protein
MQKYLQDTVALTRKGDYEEALKRHLWFHEHALEHQPSMYGVRLSFALSYWKQLGAVYPPAIEAMKRVRDESAARLEKGVRNASLFHDVVSLNDSLEENARTVELFRKLDQDQPASAREYWRMASQQILQARAYDLAKKYVGNLMAEYEQIKTKLDRMQSAIVGLGRQEALKANSERSFVDETLLLIDLAVALNDMNTARQIQSKALGVVYDERLKTAIPEQP